MQKQIFNDRLHLCFVSIVQEHPGLPHGQHGLQDLSMELALQQTLHADLIYNALLLKYVPYE